MRLLLALTEGADFVCYRYRLARFASALAALAAAPALRREMGCAARRRVEREFSVAAWGPRLVRVIEAAARCRAPRSVAA